MSLRISYILGTCFCAINAPSIVTRSPAQTFSFRPKTENLRLFDQRHPRYGYDVTKSLPASFVKNGTEDYTIYLQKAINEHDTLVFPPFPIKVNDNGLVIGSNKVITFLPGSVLLLQPSNKPVYDVLKIAGANNVTLNNPVITGDRDTHIGNRGEWGNGIGVYSSSNITINQPKVSECWGDGIYLGRLKRSPTVNYNIKINKAVLVHNRRNGISVISVNGLALLSPRILNTDGTLPMAGIDFEPNSPFDELKNIEVVNPLTVSNKGAGISLGLKNLYGGNDKQIDIKITHPTDSGSGIGLRTTATLTRRISNEIVSGTIFVEKPLWVKNNVCPLLVNILDQHILLKITSPTLVDTRGKKLDKSLAVSTLLSSKTINKVSRCTILL